MEIRGFMHRLRVLVAPESYAREVEAEIRFHLELEAMHARGDSASEIEAHWEARRRFGNVTQTKEEVRRMSGIEWFDRIRQDLGYAIRGLRQSPGFTAAVVLTLGLGLGVNAAMFTFLDRVFVRPPAAVVDAGQVRRLYTERVRPKGFGGKQDFEKVSARWSLSEFRYPEIREMARAADSGIQLGVFRASRDSVGIRVGANLLSARRTLANTAYFSVLGVRPLLGRFFDLNEDRIETPAAVAVISHDLWRRAFGLDPRVVGSRFWIKGKLITIVGVAPEKFLGTELDRSEFWMPLNNGDYGRSRSIPWYDSRQSNFTVVTRLPTAVVEQRFVEVATRALRTVHVPELAYDSTALVRTGPILSALGPATKDQEISISMRLGGVALIVLLIAVANVSNLLLVRATRRSREIAVRRALGVSRWRLFEQLFTESLLLALIGGVVSIVLAIWAGTALRSLLLPRVNWATGTLDSRMALFAAGGAIVIGFLVGLAPAFHAWRPNLVASLKAGSKDGAYRRSRVRSTLLTAQAALSVVLLVGAGLFVRSLKNVQAIDVGFDVDRTLIVSAVSDNSGIGAAMDAAMPDILRRLSAIPGVEVAVPATAGPMQTESYETHILPGHDSLPEVGGQRGAGHVDVSPGYFRASGLRVVAGRVFTESDRSGVVVSAAMAKGYWPGESAIGKCLILEDKNAPCVPVIGVVEDTHRFSVIEDQMVAKYYVSRRSERSTIILRAAPERHAAISKLVIDEVKRAVPMAELVRVRSMSANMENDFRPWRLGATLFTAMGLLALIVAAIGVYSVIAYGVSQRTNEMGIRVALGAQVGDIARLVVSDGLRTVAIGIGIGVIAAIAMSKLVASLLYGVSPRDPWVITFAAIVLALIGLAASVIPAMRAARVNPVNALRAD